MINNEVNYKNNAYLVAYILWEPCFQTLEVKGLILSGLHLPGPSNIAQSHKIAVNNPLCGRHRSHVTIDIELEFKKCTCTRDYSNETVKCFPMVFAILVHIIDTFFIIIVQVLRIA